jgi:hypothetical protein
MRWMERLSNGQVEWTLVDGWLSSIWIPVRLSKPGDFVYGKFSPARQVPYGLEGHARDPADGRDIRITAEFLASQRRFQLGRRYPPCRPCRSARG